MKKGPLSNTEKYYIEQNSTTLVKELAKFIDKSEEKVREYLKELKVEPTEDLEKTNVRAPDGRKLFDRKRGAVVGTQRASERADTLREKKLHKKINKKQIHRPFGSE